jgi:hypothetical protein
VPVEGKLGALSTFTVTLVPKDIAVTINVERSGGGATSELPRVDMKVSCCVVETGSWVGYIDLFCTIVEMGSGLGVAAEQNSSSLNLTHRCRIIYRMVQVVTTL